LAFRRFRFNSDLIFSNNPQIVVIIDLQMLCLPQNLKKRISDRIPQKTKNATNWAINVWVQWAEQRNFIIFVPRKGAFFP
jgi:hypothetical protein